MSVSVMTEVWANSKHKGNVLLTLLALADNANDDGFCWPGIDTLASKVRVSRSTVMRCVDKLVESGELYARRSRRHGNKYLVLIGKNHEQISDSLRKYLKFSADKVQAALEQIDKCQSDTNLSKSQNDTSEVAPVQHEKSHSYDTSEVAPVQHDPSFNHQEEPSDFGAKKPTRQRSPKQMALDAMIEALVSALSLDREKITKALWSELRGAGNQLLEAHATPEEMPLLFAWCAQQKWTAAWGAHAMAKNYANWDKTRKAAVIGETISQSQKTRAALYEEAS